MHHGDQRSTLNVDRSTALWNGPLHLLTDNRLQIAHGSIKQAQARAGAAGGAIASNQTGAALTTTSILTGSADDHIGQKLGPRPPRFFCRVG